MAHGDVWDLLKEKNICLIGSITIYLGGQLIFALGDV